MQVNDNSDANRDDGSRLSPLGLLRLVFGLGLTAVVAILGLVLAIALLVGGAYGLGLGITHFIDMTTAEAILVALLAIVVVVMTVMWFSLAGRLSDIRMTLLLDDEDERAFNDEELTEEIAEKVRESLVAEAMPRINDPCPCGSTKKYKNCCGR